MEVSGAYHVGGLIGSCNNGGNLIHSCWTSGNVTGTSSSVGGLVGSMENASVLECYALGDVSSPDHSYVGGLIGDIYGVGSKFIKRCYAEGNVLGSGPAGGFIGSGYNIDTISECFAKGNVLGYGNLGGLMGDAGNCSIIKNCYAIGDVAGDDIINWWIDRF